jgi:tetratricopeptide (TPR) repeat protein
MRGIQYAAVVMVLATGLAAGARAQEAATPAAGGGSEDPAFAAAMAAYGARASGIPKHREAWAAFVRLAAERPTDHAMQIWCSRTSFHLAHRHIQADDKESCAKVAQAGVECANRAQAIRPGDYDGRYWELMNRFKAGATMSFVSGLKAAKPMRAALEALISRDPRRVEGYLFLAMAYRELPSVVSWGDDEKALEYAKKAYAIAPRDPEVLLELGECWHENGDDDKARELLRRIATSDVPKDLEWETDDCRRWAVKRLKDLE